MPNLNSNRIDATLTAASIQEAKNELHSFEDLLPFLTGLTPQERMTLPKINVSNKIFVEDSLMHIQNTPGVLPPYVDVVKLKNDLVLYTQMDELLSVARRIVEKLEDTMMLAGSEAFVMSLVAYRLFAAAAVAGVPGADTAYNHLQQRFKQASEGEVIPEEEIPTKK